MITKATRPSEESGKFNSNLYLKTSIRNLAYVYT